MPNTACPGNKTLTDVAEEKRGKKTRSRRTYKRDIRPRQDDKKKKKSRREKKKDKRNGKKEKTKEDKTTNRTPSPNLQFIYIISPSLGGPLQYQVRLQPTSIGRRLSFWASSKSLPAESAARHGFDAAVARVPGCGPNAIPPILILRPQRDSSVFLGC
jgi:hypothetical protein